MRYGDIEREELLRAARPWIKRLKYDIADRRNIGRHDRKCRGGRACVARLRRKYARVVSSVVVDMPAYKKEALISYEDTPCFRENRHTLQEGGSFVMDYAPSVYICLEEEALITGDGYEKPIRRGDYFYLPYAAEGKFTVTAQKHAVVIEYLPSKQ